MAERLQAARLTKEEELDLFQRLSRATGKERERLRHKAVEEFLWLIPINSARFGRYHQEDLEQEGAIALFRAVDGFEVSRGLRFSTYAVHWLRQAFYQYLYNHGATVRLPIYMQKAMARVRQHKDTSGFSEHLIQTARELNERQTVSLEHNLIEDPESVEERVSELRRAIHDEFSGLHQRERYLVEQHYLQGRTYRDLGEESGVSGERIRQVIQRGLDKLRRSSLRSYL